MSAIEVIASQDESMSQPEPGLRRQVMSWSPDMMLVRHRMKKGWKTGDSFLVPGDLVHQASAQEDSEVLDIFTPYREDYAPAV
jgi:hypothetical protein